MAKRYYTIRVSRTFAHFSFVCMILGFCFLLIAFPSLDSSRETGSITADLRAGTDKVEAEKDEANEPMVVVEYDPVEAAKQREEKKRLEQARAREAKAKRDLEADRKAKVERADPRRRPTRPPPRREPRVEETRVVETRVVETPSRIKLPNGMKGCAKPSLFGRGYNVNNDANGELDPSCKMDAKEVTIYMYIAPLGNFTALLMLRTPYTCTSMIHIL